MTSFSFASDSSLETQIPRVGMMIKLTHWDIADAERSLFKVSLIWLRSREWSCHKFPLWESLTPREKTDHSHRDEKLHKQTLSQNVIPSICFPKSPFAPPVEALSPSLNSPIKLVFKPLSLAIQGTSSSECSYRYVNKMCFLLLICLLSINLQALGDKT